MNNLVVTPKRARERQLIAAFKQAMSIRPSDAHAEIRDGRTNRRLTYPQNKDLHQAQLAHLTKKRHAAQQTLVTPNVCLSQPLVGFQPVFVPGIRF